MEQEDEDGRRLCWRAKPLYNILRHQAGKTVRRFSSLLLFGAALTAAAQINSLAPPQKKEGCILLRNRRERTGPNGKTALRSGRDGVPPVAAADRSGLKTLRYRWRIGPRRKT